MLCFSNNNIVVDTEMLSYVILYLKGRYGGQLIILMIKKGFYFCKLLLKKVIQNINLKSYYCIIKKKKL